ncbi:MAG: phosphate signaling complex protein PhoU [Phycisphaeraceae bacterium]|nr:phosphate signaling complex protein PhoU [Phycisphaeraceae bacterium]
MSQHLQNQFDKLKRMILNLGAQVEDCVQGAVRAVEMRNEVLAQKIIEEDTLIDQAELDVEEECLHTLACYQPVAMDLRFVVSLLKINNDLERIADLAVNIAEQAQFLTAEPPMEGAPFHLPEMARQVQSMLQKCLDALVHRNAELAESVRQSDDGVDRMHRRMYEIVQEKVGVHPERVTTMMHFVSISRQLERIADHAVNIAEDVIYMINGQILRHSRPHETEASGSRQAGGKPGA